LLKIENEKDAIPLGKALIDGNLPITEITFRTEAAEQAIKNITTNIPDLLVGAGTVLTVEQVKKAVGLSRYGMNAVFINCIPHIFSRRF
jgi:2-dehydro-3-deoxyphosphogluconate aldolase/(4S)-4-hydroxy-2-oxoglutarate aldolase